MSGSSDPNIGEIHGIILEGAGGVCRTCGFRYWEYRGHILACPVCALAEAEAMAIYLRGELNGTIEQRNDARTRLAACEDALRVAGEMADYCACANMGYPHATQLVAGFREAMTKVEAAKGGGG